jgi:hypothetical protein
MLCGSVEVDWMNFTNHPSNQIQPTNQGFSLEHLRDSDVICDVDNPFFSLAEVKNIQLSLESRNLHTKIKDSETNHWLDTTGSDTCSFTDEQ